MALRLTTEVQWVFLDLLINYIRDVSSVLTLLAERRIFLGFSYILWKRNLDNREIEINNNHSLRYLPFRLDSTEFTGLPDDHKVQRVREFKRERVERHILEVGSSFKYQR